MAVAHSPPAAPVHSKTTPLSNVVEIVAMLLIPLASVGAFAMTTGDTEQGWVFSSR
jgi:K+-transporting ATPase A subunit